MAVIRFRPGTVPDSSYRDTDATVLKVWDKGAGDERTG